jgi:very-short-patch-repair endonuclease
MRRRRIRGSTVELEKKAREMREWATPAEELLWGALRGEQIRGFQFRRQHPVGRFVFDFCCTKARLIIEVDGQHHYNDPDQRERDAARDAFLANGGYTTLRFTNTEVLKDLASVVARIDAALPPREPTADAVEQT